MVRIFSSNHAFLGAFLLLGLFLCPQSTSAQNAVQETVENLETEVEDHDSLTTPPIDFKLKNADIDSIVDFVGKYTNKPVMKDKKVSAKLTISAPEKILPYQALDLIYDALRLEGFVVIENEDLIQIVSAEDTSKFEIQTFTDPLPEEVARQKGRLIRKIIPLQNVLAENMKAQIEPLLGKHASVSADQRTNKLIVTDTIRNIDRYESILAQLDVVGFDNMEVRIVTLEYADATVLADILDETVVKAGGDGRPQRPGETPEQGFVSVIPDVRTNSLVIASPMERMESIVDFIRRLDVPKPTEVGVHVVQIQYADAQAISRAVSDLFQRRSTGKSLADTIEVRATGRDNALLILASDENYDLIMEVIQALDTEDAQKRETRKFELEHLDADDTAEELKSLYNETQQSNRFFFYSSRFSNEPQVNFVPITRANAILVIAPPTEFKLIESLIDEIDQPINTEEVLPRFYQLKNARARDVTDVLNDVFALEDSGSSNDYWNWWRDDTEEESIVGRLTGKIKFSFDENTNSVIAISNNASNYEIVDRMIQELDRSIPELANTLVVQLQYADAKKLADTLNTLFGKPVAPEGSEDEEAQQERFTYWWGADEDREEDDVPISKLIDQVRFVPDMRTNSILVITAAQNFDIVEGLIRDLDKEEPQVLIQVRIVEVRRDKDQRTGLRWTPDATAYSPEDLDNAVRVMQGLDLLDTFGGEIGGITDVNSTSLQGRTLSTTLDASRGILSTSVNIDLLLQLLIKNLDSEIVISPSLYVSNNEPGRIFVGENIPRLKNSQLTAEGTRNDSFENEDIGIDMKITPNISSNGLVVLTVELSTAQTTGQTRFGSDILQKREYNTKVAVQGGETMVLGGIRLTNKLDQVRKFPILGSIPLIGYLFRNTVKVDTSTDLYAFITPEIIASRQEGNKATTRIRDEIGDVQEGIRE